MRLLALINTNVIKGIKIIVPLLILFLICYEAKWLFADFDWHLIELYLDRLTFFHIVYILVLGLIALVPMYYYDVILLKLFNIHIPRRKLLFLSLSANSYSNLVGFGGVAGATLRSYYYRDYVSDKEGFLKKIAKLSLFYLTGLSILALAIIFMDVPLFKTLNFARIAVIAIALYTPILLIVFVFRRKSWNLQVLQKGYIGELLLISLFEWIFVIICIWGIANVLGANVSFSVIFPIVVLSSCLGIASMIPGGIGSFDVVFLIGMEAHGIATELTLLILMFYRLSYYLVPAFISTPFVVTQLWKKWKYLIN